MSIVGDIFRAGLLVVEDVIDRLSDPHGREAERVRIERELRERIKWCEDRIVILEEEVEELENDHEPPILRYSKLKTDECLRPHDHEGQCDGYPRPDCPSFWRK